MCVDHLGELLDHVVEGVIVARHIILSYLLVERSQPQQRHNVGVRVGDGDVEGLAPGIVHQMVVSPETKWIK